MRCEGFGCREVLDDGTQILGCDTIYAVDKEHFAKNWIPIKKADELLNILKLYDLPKNIDIVITGGEPLIYADDEIFVEFLNALVKSKHKITFETNGSLGVDFEKYAVYKECVFALSVKLENSGESYKKRIKPDVISSITTNAKESFFKFSVDAQSIDASLDAQIDEISSYALDAQIFCMPVAKDKKQLQRNSLPLIEYCKDKGYNFSDRLHMRIWDKEKGV
jgi:organic radical activating enzyme